MVRTAVISGYGINADEELVTAFRAAGSAAEKIHIQDVIASPGMLHSYDILGFPGGFSFGDHLGSGKVFSYMFRKALKNTLDNFVSEGKCIIGICNGFQVLVKMGVLPNLSGNWHPEVSLIHNDSGVFEDSWVRVQADPESSCIWTEGLSELDLPVRHGEGKFVSASEEVRAQLKKEKLIALTYKGRNPNGSEMDIAGITDRTGRILGLMPHPEAYLFPETHPQWMRKNISEAEGLKIIRNGVNFISKFK